MGVGRPAAGITAPILITQDHDVSRFDCGKPELNDWLKTKAVKQQSRSAQTRVVCEGNSVVAYYAINAGAVEHAGAPGTLRRNMPDPIPVIVIGRLAVDRSHHGKGLGADLLRDALARIALAAQEVGALAVMVHAIDDEAVPFYTRHDFKPFPTNPRTLYLPIAQIRDAVRLGP